VPAPVVVGQVAVGQGFTPFGVKLSIMYGSPRRTAAVAVG